MQSKTRFQLAIDYFCHLTIDFVCKFLHNGNNPTGWMSVIAGVVLSTY